MTSHARPGRLEDVRVAVICALPREYDAALLILDEKWKPNEDTDGRAREQPPNHTIGRVGSHIIVLVLLLNMGKVGAAAETARLRSIYSGLELALLTGICGGVPSPGTANEILLGDVVISKSIVQYDIGRQYPGKFARKDTAEDNLGRPNKDIRTLLIVLETQSALNELQQRVRQNLAHVQQEATNADYRTSYSRPSTAEDVLFEPAYSHRHRVQPKCGCGDSFVCDRATSASCEELQCEVEYQVSRRRLASTRGGHAEDGKSTTAPETRIHIGRVGSGDTVMKSGEHRDNVAKAHGLVAFEMEGAGVWDEIPCIVVKGVCDYADSHKNKKWQDFAAAVAAATARALLERYPAKEKPQDTDANLMPQRTLVMRPKTSQKPSDASHYVIPLAKNKRFVERTETSELKRMLFDEANSTVALVGLGGMGKTQIALDLAYWVKENKPEYSVFWVPALNLASFEQAYVDVARVVGISPPNEGEDIKSAVRHFLSSTAGPWFLIIDNADNNDILLGLSDDQDGLYSYLPQSENGVTLFTTRLRDLALSVADDAVVDLDAMSRDDAMELFGRSLHQQRRGLLQDSDSTLKLLDFLTCLPLAITQASAYLNRNRHVSVARYLELVHGTEQTRMSTLSREFDDRTRYPKSRNAISTTWLVSFDQIQKTDSYATELLCFISRIEPKSIPRSILYCSGSEDDMEYAIGTLCSYAFLIDQGDAQSFDMHSLVHLAARFWTKQQSAEEEVTRSALRHFFKIFPTDHFRNRNVWRQYMPHALKLCGEQTQMIDIEVQTRLCINIGLCLQRDARFKEAVKLLEHLVGLNVKLDEEHPARLASQYALAGAYRNDGQTKRAIKLLERIVEVKATLDEDAPERLASQHALAMAYRNDGQTKRAIKLLEHLVGLNVKLNKEHPERLASKHVLARAYHDDGQTKRAIKLLEHIVEVEATLDEDDPERLASQHALAMAYHNDGQTKRAIELLERIVEVKATLDEDAPDRLLTEYDLAQAYHSDGRIQEAIKLLEHVVEVKAKILDEGHRSRLVSQHDLAQAYHSDGRIQEAIKLLEHVVEIEAKTLDEGDPGRLVSQHELARVYHLDGRIEEAIKLLEHVVEVEAKTLDEGDPERVVSQQLLAKCLAELPVEAI